MGLHSGAGSELCPIDRPPSFRPRALHVGVWDSYVYRLVLDGPWNDYLHQCGRGSALYLDVSIEHYVQTQRLLQRIT